MKFVKLSSPRGRALAALAASCAELCSAQRSTLPPPPPSPAPPAQTQEAIPALPAGEPKSAPVSDEERIARKVRHALVMQSRFSIWDWLAFRVNGSTVELLGSVYNPSLKGDAVNTVNQIDGVEQGDRPHQPAAALARG